MGELPNGDNPIFILESYFRRVKLTCITILLTFPVDLLQLKARPVHGNTLNWE